MLLYGCTTWTLPKRMKKELDGNYALMLRAILNKSWRQYHTKQQLYGHLPPITKTIKVRRTRHAGHCRRSKDELISDMLLWTPSHGRAKVGRPARTYVQQLCAETGYSLEDRLGTMNERLRWRESVREGSTTWWWYLFYHLEYSDYFLYSNIHNFSADVSSGLLHAFHLKRTANRTLYLTMLGYSKKSLLLTYCGDWTWNLQITSFRKSSSLNAHVCCVMCSAWQFRLNF